MSKSENIAHFSSDGNTAKFAYDMLIRHLCAAKLQMQRIVEAMDRVARSQSATEEIIDISQARKRMEEAKTQYDSIFIEIHFYLVSWVNCRNMIKSLCSLPEYSEASIYYQSIRKHFDDYAEARNTFEHFHDRLPKGKKSQKVKEVTAPNAGPRKIFAGLENGHYKFSDRTWDITPQSLNLLDELVSNFLNKVFNVVNLKRDELLGHA